MVRRLRILRFGFVRLLVIGSSSGSGSAMFGSLMVGIVFKNSQIGLPAMKKSSILWCVLLVAALYAAQSAESVGVGQLGGYIRSGGKTRAGASTAKSIIMSRSSYKAAQSIQNTSPSEGEAYPEKRSEGFDNAVVSLVLFLIALLLSYAISESIFVKDTSLIMVQVALKNRSLETQAVFSHMATLSDEMGFDRREARYLLSVTKRLFLLQFERCSYAASSVNVIKDKSKWKEHFEQMCNEQLSKSGGRVIEPIYRIQDEYVVVTVLVSAMGAHKLPGVKCLADVEKTFSRLESLTNYLKAVKVFWTPLDGTSSLLLEDMMEEFQELKQVQGQGWKPRCATATFA